MQINDKLIIELIATVDGRFWLICSHMMTILDVLQVIG